MASSILSRYLVRGVLLGGAAIGLGAVSLGGDRHPPPHHPSILAEDAPPRSIQLAALAGSSEASPFDILVIGGGATGSGVALDAATRGLKVALVEREDFASGTSSRSTKLVHGGVRYLEKAFLQQDIGQLKLVFHALHERGILMRNAPHLTSSLPTMTPCYSWWELPYYWGGLKAYDVMAGRSVLHYSKLQSKKETMEAFPALTETLPDSGKSLKGSVVYFDGQMDDARVNLSLALTAARAGAVVLNHATVTGLTRDEEGTGKVHGATVKDELTGQVTTVRARVVVNATGPFCDSIRKLADGASRPLIAPSTGVHLVFPGFYSSPHTGLIVPKTDDGRVLFLLPWKGRTVVGTTDNPTTEISNRPAATQGEIAFILDGAKKYLAIDVRREDILSVWSGIRPLVLEESSDEDGGDSSPTSAISRDHVVRVEESGVVTVAGGKWTTYRSMAEDAVDAAIRLAGISAANRCVTEHLKLTGAEEYDSLLSTRLSQQFLRVSKEGTRVGAMETAVAQHLAESYGDRAFRVAAIAQAENLGSKLVDEFPVLEAEVVYCARHEYCESAIDFVARRSRLVFLDTKATIAALPRVVELLGSEHGWSRWRKSAELKGAKEFLHTFEDVQSK